jgi:hypothetical protein
MKRLGASLAAILVALLVAAAPVRAASCNGASHQATLSNGTANPASGEPSTPITFSVAYADSGDCAPSAVAVVITGVGSFVLSPSGTTFAAGVMYTGTVTLEPGTYPFSFTATSGSGHGEKTVALTTVSPSAIVIQPPPPAPTPVPTPVATPFPAPVAPVPPAPRVAAPVAPAKAPAPSPPVSPTAAATPTSPARSDAADPGSGPSGSPTVVPARPPTSVHDSWVGMPAAPGGAGTGAAWTADLGWPIQVPAVTVVVATGAGLAYFAFILRRRRVSAVRVTGAPPVAAGAGLPLPSVRTATGIAPAQVAVTPLPPMRELIPPVDPDLLRDPVEAEGPLPEEAGIPRWLRPSVRAGRREHPDFRRRGWG